MVIEYKISFENGSVVIHHHVEDAPSPKPTAGSNGAGGVLLPKTFPGSSAATSGGGGGNSDPSGLGGGGGNSDPSGLGGGGGNSDPGGLGGGGTGQGQVVVFGPIVIDASGLLAKNGVTVKTNTEEKSEKPGK